MKLLTADGKTWTSSEGYSLHFSAEYYRLLQDTIADLGWYTVLQIKDDTILQLKNKTDKERFFTVNFDTTDKKLILTEASVTLNGVVLTGTAPLVFE